MSGTGNWKLPAGLKRHPLSPDAMPTGRAGPQPPRPAPKPTRGRKNAVQSPEVFLAALKARGLPTPHREYRFHDTRLWRFDYAFPQQSVAVEVDGGLFVQGAHNRGARILKTHAKLNCAASMGWRILYTIPQNLCTEEFLTVLESALARAEGGTRPSAVEDLTR